MKNHLLTRQAAVNMFQRVLILYGVRSFPSLQSCSTYFFVQSSSLSRHVHLQSKVKLDPKPINKLYQTLFKSFPHEERHSPRPGQCRWLRQNSAKSATKHHPGLYSLSVDNLLPEKHIKRLAGGFGCSVAEMKTLVKGHAFLIHMDLDLLQRKVNLLLSYDLPVDFIKHHLGIVYQTSERVLEQRLKLLKDSGLLHSRHLEIDKLAHLLECNDSQFPKSFQYKLDQRDALDGCQDQLAYLQMRLSCSKEKAQSMMSSYPLERHVSNVKLKALLDFFLIEAERSPDFIIMYRKLLSFSVRRLQHRWRVIQAAGLESEAQMVYVWCMSQKEFNEQYSEQLESENSSLSASSAQTT